MVGWPVDCAWVSGSLWIRIHAFFCGNVGREKHLLQLMQTFWTMCYIVASISRFLCMWPGTLWTISEANKSVKASWGCRVVRIGPTPFLDAGRRSHTKAGLSWFCDLGQVFLCFVFLMYVVIRLIVFGVSTSAISCLERLVSEMSYYVPNVMLNPTELAHGCEA